MHNLPKDDSMLFATKFVVGIARLVFDGISQNLINEILTLKKKYILVQFVYAYFSRSLRYAFFHNHLDIL